MGFPLVPRLSHPAFVRALLAQVYAPGAGPEDYLVLARRADIAASRATELLKQKSESRENLAIARQRLKDAEGEQARCTADAKIFEQDHTAPPPKRVLGFIPVDTPELKKHRTANERLRAAAGAAAARVAEAKKKAEALEKQHSELVRMLAVAEAERDRLRDEAVSAGVFLLLHHNATGEDDQVMEALKALRSRARGDLRVLVCWAFTEAVFQGPAAANALVRDYADGMQGRPAPEVDLATAVVRFMAAGTLTPAELPPVTEENYSHPAHYELHCLLAAANGLRVASGVPERLLALHAALGWWFHKSQDATGLTAIQDWQENLPLTELTFAALLRLELPDAISAMFGLEVGEMQRLLNGRKSDRQEALKRVQRLAEQRIRFGPIHEEMVERVLCLLLVALKAAAPPELYAFIREEIRVSDCGNAYELLRSMEESREPRFRRTPGEFYWAE